MGGVTHKIEEAVKALEEGKVKKALYLTDTGKTERHHRIVSEAAAKCLSDKEQCGVYLKDAAQRLKETITPPLDESGLEGVGEMLEEKPEQAAEKTDAELYEECEECHVSDAVVKFHEIAEHCGDAATIESIQKTLDDEPPPEQWIKTMVGIAEKPSCGEESYKVVLGELTDYLQKRDSPILKKLEVDNG